MLRLLFILFVTFVVFALVLGIVAGGVGQWELLIWTVLLVGTWYGEVVHYRRHRVRADVVAGA